MAKSSKKASSDTGAVIGEARCYVYSILVDGRARYIGKGTGPRCHYHLREVRRIARCRAVGEAVRTSYFHNKLCKAWRDGSEISVVVLIDHLTSDDAFDVERKMIAATNGLWNVTAGGLIGGLICEEFREHLSAKHKAVASKPSVKARRSAAMTLAHNTPEFRAWRSQQAKARMNTQERKQEMSERSKAMWADPDHRTRHQEALKRARQRPDTALKHNTYHASAVGRENLTKAAHAAWAARRNKGNVLQ